jgi:hypothetical protein
MSPRLRSGDTHRVWFVCPLVLIAISVLLISGLPTSIGGSPSGPSPTGAPARAVPAPSTLPAAVAPSRTGRNADSLCLLGVTPGCRPTSELTGLTPAVAGPSSWTNITPRAGLANPPNLFLPSVTYYPGGHEVLLFGGFQTNPSGTGNNATQATWAYSGGTWTELIPAASCTATTCPSPRYGAMMTYYPPDQGVLLFGGFTNNPLGPSIALNDTWLFAGGAWTNVTAQSGSAPSARFSGSMAWDAIDDYVLLFGGSLASGVTLGDTWAFNGTWHNLTVAEGRYVPVNRAGAAIAGSPSGYLMMYGGESDGVTISDYTLCGSSSVAWWFYAGSWRNMSIEPCIFRPASGDPVNGTNPPCGRVGAALGWSPQNSRFVLFGGYGPVNQTLCSGPLYYLNDTWSFLNPPGDGFHWGNATDPGDPSARYEMGYATDLTDRYFEIFGGFTGEFAHNDTWRFAELVHAELTGPSAIETAGNPLDVQPFRPTGFGGSGNLDYWLSLRGLKTGHSLAGTGCGNLTGQYNVSVPYDGVDSVLCLPTPASYNVYRLTVHVWDVANASDQATANWTFAVDPPEAIAVYSQYVGVFYTGVSLTDTLGVLALAAGAPALAVYVTVDGSPIFPSPVAGQPAWWNLTVDTEQLSPGPNLVVATATFALGWELNATYELNVVKSPTWLLTIVNLPTVTQKISPGGTGPYNQTYSLSETWQWALNKALAFALPIPLATGNYSLVPGLNITLVATSQGVLRLTGGISLAPPKIALGPVNLNLTAVVSLDGEASLTYLGGQVETVTWNYATAQVSIVGKFSGDVPIYGFSVLGVTVGFALTFEVDPAVAIDLVLAPTQEIADEAVSGIAIAIEHVFGSFSLPIKLGVKFGIGIASIELGGTLGVALEFALNPHLSIAGGWVNGSVFVQASALFWSDTWSLLSGTIYSWTDPPAGGLPLGGPPTVGYNNGTATNWTLATRYYGGVGYDALTWNPARSNGTAISDVYPNTEVTAAWSPEGTLLFYTNDNVDQSVEDGLEVSGLTLNASSNALVAVAAPSDPGYEISSPRATSLPDGDVYLLWSALPDAETSLPAPTALTSLQVHGATYDPRTGDWSPVQRWTTSELAQSYLVDATGGSERVAVLVSQPFLVGTTTPEHLLEFNLTSGALLANVSVMGIAELESMRGASGSVLVRTVDGMYSALPLGSETVPSPAALGPAGASLVSASYVSGSASDLVLLFRGANGSDLVVANGQTDRATATLALSPDAFDAEGIAGGSAEYVFVRTHAGVLGWSLVGGTFSNLSSVSVPGVVSYGLVQEAGGVLVYCLSQTGNASQPIVALDLAEGGAPLPVPIPYPLTSAAPSSPAGSGLSPLVYLALGAAVVALLLAVVAVVGRRRPPAGREPVGSGSSSGPAETSVPTASPPPSSPPGAGPESPG